MTPATVIHHAERDRYSVCSPQTTGSTDNPSRTPDTSTTVPNGLPTAKKAAKATTPSTAATALTNVPYLAYRWIAINSLRSADIMVSNQLNTVTYYNPSEFRIRVRTDVSAESARRDDHMAKPAIISTVYFFSFRHERLQKPQARTHPPRSN